MGCGARPAALALLLLLLALLPPAGAAEVEVALAGGETVPVAVQPAEGRLLILWLPSERGLSPRQQPTAEALAALGLEVWTPDLHGAFFLPPGRSSLEAVPPEVVRQLIEAAEGRTGKGVYLLAAGHSAALALTGARAWQLAHPGERGLHGAILLHPNLYAATPQGGSAAAYLPIASASNLPLYIFQPLLSASRWHLRALVEALEQGGSRVITHALEGVSDGFNVRPDFDPAEEATTRRLPRLIQQATWLLEDYAEPAQAAPLPDEPARKEASTGAKLLKPYRGEGPTPALSLTDLDGAAHTLAELRGQVVLVNFWATWCPPCVKELPSLQRLYGQLRERGLAILAVDVGEPAGEVRSFVAPFGLGFPVLLDEQGAALDRWRVHAFPTNFIVDRTGTIRYAFFGALEWDAPEVLATLEPLLEESAP